MKKLIVTLCSLALSLAGTFGINQLTSNDEAIKESNNQQVVIEQDVEAIEQVADTDQVKIDTKEREEDKASEVEVTTPKIEDTEIIDTDNTKEEIEVKKNTNKKNTNKKNTNKKNTNEQNTNKKDTNKKNTNEQNTNKRPVKDDTRLDTSNSQNKAFDYTDSTKTNSNKAYVYKNIDLSKCNSISDVVEKLQKSGFKNIDINNIQNISSLEDILSMIDKQEANATKPEPTQAPTKPVPTTAPTKPTPTTTPSKPAPTTPPTNNSGSNQGYAEEVLRLVNIERSKAGLSSLTTNATLKAAADKRAQETKASFSHTRPNGSKFSTVLQEYGISYRTAGENIAYGQRSPQEVVNGWMNSPGHRANILNGSFGKIGIGVYQSGGVIYWSQLFTN